MAGAADIPDDQIVRDAFRKLTSVHHRSEPISNPNDELAENIEINRWIVDLVKIIGYFRLMETDAALSILSALAHPTRLATFRTLIQHEPEGLSTGQLVDACGLTQSTFSTHLAVLAKAGLVISEKQGRQQIQRANIDALRGLMLFLAKDCCEGRAELCEPLLAELTCS